MGHRVGRRFDLHFKAAAQRPGCTQLLLWWGRLGVYNNGLLGHAGQDCCWQGNGQCVPSSGQRAAACCARPRREGAGVLCCGVQVQRACARTRVVCVALCVQCVCCRPLLCSVDLLESGGLLLHVGRAQPGERGALAAPSLHTPLFGPWRPPSRAHLHVLHVLTPCRVPPARDHA